MPLFTYKALDSDGEIIKGSIEEEDMDLAYNTASSSGLYILNIRKSSSLRNLLIKFIDIFKIYKARGVKTRDIIEFADNLAVMLRGGVSLITALTDISEVIENRHFKRIVEDINDKIKMGSSLSLALSSYKDVFPENFLNIVAVGEETGRLDQSLSDIVSYLQKMETLKSTMKRALITPVFAIVATTGALFFWLIYVIPKVSPLFQDMGVKLPLPTRILIALGDVAQTKWHLLLLIPLIMFGIFKLSLQIEAVRYYIDGVKLKLPIIKLLVFNKMLILFLEQLRALFSAGIPINRAFDITAKAVDNFIYRKAILSIKEDILLGSRIFEAIKKHPALFPNIVVSMIACGEESGNLPEQLDYLSTEFTKRLNDVSEKIGKLIEPLVIIVIGGIFLLFIVGLLLPIYDLISTMGMR